MNNMITNQTAIAETVATITSGDEHKIEGIVRKLSEQGKPVFDTDSFLYMEESDEFTTIITCFKITTIVERNKLDEQDPHTYNLMRASTTDEDIENQVSDPLYNDSTWWNFEADVYSVFTYEPLISEIPKISDKMKTGPSRNSFLYVLENFDDLLKHEKNLQKIGFHDGTNIEFAQRPRDNSQYKNDARQQLIIGDTGSAKSTYQGLEIIRAMYGHSNIGIIDEKKLYAGQGLASTQNFHNHVKKSGRVITNVYPDLFMIDMQHGIFETLFPKERFFCQKGGFGRLKSDEIESCNTEFCTQLFSEDLKTFREAWLNEDLDDTSLIKEVLNNFDVTQVYRSDRAQRRLQSSIDSICTNPEILNYLGQVLKEVRFLFSRRKGSLSVGQIVRKLLLDKRSLVVINKNPLNPTDDQDLVEKLYFFMIGEIFSRINFIFNNLQGEYKDKGSFPCIVFIDEGQRYFSKDEHSHQKKIIKNVASLMNNYRGRNFSFSVTTPDPMLLKDSIRNRLMDHDLAIGSTLTTSAEREISNKISKEARKKLPDIPANLSTTNSSEQGSLLTESHYLLIGNYSPLDQKKKGLIMKLDISKMEEQLNELS